MKTLCGEEDCLGCFIKYSNDINMCRRERDRNMARKKKTISTSNDTKQQSVDLSKLKRSIQIEERIYKMSYDIDFRVPVHKHNDVYVTIGGSSANATWNLRDMIEKSTGLEWKNEANNGRCLDVIPCISRGLIELVQYPEKYKQYEAKNGWGTIQGCIEFFRQILKDWATFCSDSETKDLIDVAYFWIC